MKKNVIFTIFLSLFSIGCTQSQPAEYETKLYKKAYFQHCTLLSRSETGAVVSCIEEGEIEYERKEEPKSKESRDSSQIQHS